MADRLARIKSCLEGIPQLEEPSNRSLGEVMVADIQWTVAEIDRLQARLDKAEQVVKTCLEFDFIAPLPPGLMEPVHRWQEWQAAEAAKEARDENG